MPNVTAGYGTTLAIYANIRAHYGTATKYIDIDNMIHRCFI